MGLAPVSAVVWVRASGSADGTEMEVPGHGYARLFWVDDDGRAELGWGRGALEPVSTSASSIPLHLAACVAIHHTPAG